MRSTELNFIENPRGVFADLWDKWNDSCQEHRAVSKGSSIETVERFALKMDDGFELGCMRFIVCLAVTSNV